MRFLITGGAGFIGSNTADHLLVKGHYVILLDNLSRAGSEKNLSWLREKHPGIPFHQVDIRDLEAVKQVLAASGNIDVLFHFAAQVAVTTSVEKPIEDFEINAWGTLNVLEAVRAMKLDPIFMFASTNKVYGELGHLEVVEAETRYQYHSLPDGVGEGELLDFHSPYGCSKGAADQYVHDYHRIYGLRTIVFRNSCIYGPRQFGVEDQGWLAWLTIAAVLGRQITIYGDGKQVRDVLHVDDLIRAMLSALENHEVTSGEVYNIGGGPRNTLAVWSEFGPMLEDLMGNEVVVQYAGWRPGDQKVYISDISKAESDFGWIPKVDCEDGVERLFRWVKENQELFEV
ncbi:MAG: SDR family NAD(P)-dependent oxidoreductase [Anaerolineales bacterium]|nr:SDR family NAD(P)-dependent oxidoreductase [Anaerolineales bacterium]